MIHKARRQLSNVCCLWYHMCPLCPWITSLSEPCLLCLPLSEAAVFTYLLLNDRYFQHFDLVFHLFTYCPQFDFITFDPSKKSLLGIPFWIKHLLWGVNWDCLSSLSLVVKLPGEFPVWILNFLPVNFLLGVNLSVFFVKVKIYGITGHAVIAKGKVELYLAIPVSQEALLFLHPIYLVGSCVICSSFKVISLSRCCSPVIKQE